MKSLKIAVPIFTLPLVFIVSCNHVANSQMTSSRNVAKGTQRTSNEEKNARGHGHVKFARVTITREDAKRFRRHILDSSPSFPSSLSFTHSVSSTERPKRLCENVLQSSETSGIRLSSNGVKSTCTTKSTDFDGRTETSSPLSPATHFETVTVGITSTTTKKMMPMTTVPPPPPPPPPSLPPLPPLPPIPYAPLTRPPLQNPQCPSWLSCEGRCAYSGFSTYHLNCHCDPECEVFMDCCADYDRYCNASIARPTTTAEMLSLWKCQRILNNQEEIRMMSGCPSSWSNASVEFNCLENSDKPLSYNNYVDAVPVVDKQTNKTYRNRFCATCNGVANSDLVSYAIDFRCTVTPPKGLSHQKTVEFMFKYCNQIKWTPKEGQPVRKCFNVVTRCSSPECMLNPPRVVHHWLGRNYKNIHCAECFFKENLPSLMCGPRDAGLQPPPTPAPFNIIMDVDGHNHGRKPHQIDLSCGDGKVYDTHLELCRPTLLKLPSTPESSQFDKYRIAMWVTPSSPSKMSILMLNRSDTVKLISKNIDIDDSQIHIKEKSQQIGSKFAIVIFDVQISEDDMARRVLRNVDGIVKISISSILEFSSPLHLHWNKDMFTIIKATSKRTGCINIKYYNTNEYTVMKSSNNVFINKTGKILNEKEYFAKSTTTLNGIQIPVGEIAACTQEGVVLGCKNGSFIVLSSNEYLVLPNSSIYRNVSGTVYNAGEYSEMKIGVIVCSNFSRKYTEHHDGEERKKTIHDTILMIMTCVGLSLSIICLLATLLTYSLFADLRTLPGINLMNLSSALLIAHFFWLVGSGFTGSHTACVTMAVILHFAFLASFAWMSIIAFSTWKAFSSSGGHIGISHDKEHRRRQIRKTMVIGWIPVLVFVLICLSLDQSAAVSIQYGGSKGCWINNGIANLCIFVVPIIIAMIWNAVFFGLTVRAICKTQKQASMVTQQRTNQHNYAVYVKIAILMGFTWIFGVLGSFVSQYFMYPFVILSTIQGVYIAFSFTFNRRALYLYKAKFGVAAAAADTSQSRKTTSLKSSEKKQLTVESKI